MIWNYLHPNQRRFYERSKLCNYDDLSEEQLLYMHNPEHRMLFPRCVELQCVAPLERIAWNFDFLRDLIRTCHEHRFCESIMNYVLEVIMSAEPHQRCQYKPHKLFPIDEVRCLQSCQWYREHGLWDNSNSNIIQKCISLDDVEWFLHETRGKEMRYFEDIISGHTGWKMNILLWIATNHDLSDQVQDLFNTTQVSVEELKQLYVAMKLDKTQVLEIRGVNRLDWYRFVLEHFTIDDPQEMLVGQKNWAPGILFMMAFEWPIPSDWDFGEYGKLLDVKDLEQLYAYAPTVFQMDLTNYKYWHLSQLRFAIEHGAYVTLPLVCLTSLTFATKADYLLDTRLPEKVVLDYMDTCFAERNFNADHCLWLAYTCARVLPHGHERFNQIFMHGVFPNAWQWTEYMNVVAEYVNWDTIDMARILDKMPKCVAKLIGHANMSRVLEVAVKNGCRSIKQIIKSCSSRKIPLQLDSDLLKKSWNVISSGQRRALLRMFPTQCPKMSTQEYGLIQHFNKRHKPNP